MRKMQVVFVHGVANRREGDGTAFDRDVANRSQLLSKITFDGKAKVRNPYWGDHGGRLRYDGACVPTADGAETLGEEKTLEVLGDPAAKSGPKGNQLLTIARKPATDGSELSGKEQLIDLIVSGMDQSENDTEESYGEAVKILSEYAKEGDWTWLDSVNTDAELIDELLPQVNAFQQQRETEKVKESLGAFDFLGKISDGFKKAVGSVVDRLSDKFMLKAKSAMTVGAAKFIGDAFVYLNSRGAATAPNEITKIALADITAAWNEAQKNGEKLVLVGHSFGGTVIWDILTHHRDLLPAGFFADAVVTGGTQVGLFMELDVYGQKLSVKPPAKTAKPDNFGIWLNSYDFADPLGFRLEPMLEGAHDFQFNTGGSLINAHNLYFGLPSYYTRLKVRLQEFKVI